MPNEETVPDPVHLEDEPETEQAQQEPQVKIEFIEEGLKGADDQPELDSLDLTQTDEGSAPRRIKRQFDLKDFLLFDAEPLFTRPI